MILVALALLMLTGPVPATTDPCQWEKDQAIATCRALGRRSPECGKRIADYKLCKAEHAGNDPLEGV